MSAVFFFNLQIFTQHFYSSQSFVYKKKSRWFKSAHPKISIPQQFNYGPAFINLKIIIVKLIVLKGGEGS